MSYTELHAGIIRELPVGNNEGAIETYCKELCELLNLTLTSDKSWIKYKSYYSRLVDYYLIEHGNYLIKDDTRLFIAIDNEYEDYICDIITSAHRDNEYPYILYFDNGGTTAIDELERLIHNKICKHSDK